jgi:hypothetical protein
MKTMHYSQIIFRNNEIIFKDHFKYTVKRLNLSLQKTHNIVFPEDIRNRNHHFQHTSV